MQSSGNEQNPEVVVSWEDTPNTWLTAAKNAFVGRAFKFYSPRVIEKRSNALAFSPHPNKVFATLLVNGNYEKFQLDSGSTVNIMIDETALKLCGQDGLSELEETPVTLVM